MNALIERVPVTAPVAGVITRWQKRPGDHVQKDDILCDFDDGEGPVVLCAPSSGILGKTVAPGAAVARNSSLAYITPDASQTRQNGHHAAIPAPAPVVSAPKRSMSHDASSAFQPPMPRRRGTLPAVVDLAPIEELVIAPEPAPLVKASPKPAKRERVKHRGYYVLRRQEIAIKRVAARLSLDEHDPLSCNDSLIIRALIDQFESLPPGKQRALVEAYRMKEELSGEGAGWPRPGRPKGNKRA